MRSTVHLLVADDALMLRRFTRPIHEQERKVSQNIRPAIDVDLDAFTVACRAALADGPLPVKKLGEALVDSFPEVPASRPRAASPAWPNRSSSCRRAAAGSSPAESSTTTSTRGSGGRWSTPTLPPSCAGTSRRTVLPPPPT